MSMVAELTSTHALCVLGPAFFAAGEAEVKRNPTLTLS